MPGSNQPTAQRTWDPWKMFDITPKEKELIEKRKAMVAENKAKFRKMVNDPKETGRGGWVLDPALQRWYTGRSTRRSHFRPDNKSFAFFLGTVVFPIVGLYYVCMKNKKKQEEDFNAGKVKIMDRWTKFHY